MTPQQYQTASRLLRTVNGGTDIGEWAKGITARNRAGLPVNKNELAIAQELLQIADKLRKSEQRRMPVMRNFRKIMERTQASYGLPASGPGADAVPGVLRAPRTERKAGQGQSKGDAVVHSAARGRAEPCGCAGGCGRTTQGVSRGEVLEVPDLWAADSQTGCDIAAGRNRPGLRLEGCAAPTTWASQENSADSRETDTAGCL